MKDVLKTDIFPYLPSHLRELLLLVDTAILERVIELRIRINQPLLVVLPERDYFIGKTGGSVGRQDAGDAYFCTATDLQQIMQAISHNSIYALAEELKKGYITLAGGHRVGLTGQAVVENNQVQTLKNFNALNFRLAREVRGCADPLLTYLFDERQVLRNTLIISPPRCGKTTLLRDLVRSLSSGNQNFSGMQVGLVDERSEIAACRQDGSTNDLGWRVDVLDCCPKAEGMLMLIRTMAPQVIVTDEIGRAADAAALAEALHAGVHVIASVHGDTLESLYQRPHVKRLVELRYFDCYVFLSNQPLIGTIKEIFLPKEGKQIYVR